jgi:hypothetical protein
MGYKKFQILSQNPKGLAFDFIKKCRFATKIDRNSVFLGRKAQILNRLHIMVSYISFYGLKKNQILAQNPKVLAFGFTEKCYFVAKTDRNFIFLGRKAQIPN